jgi:hypothetical protein
LLSLCFSGGKQALIEHVQIYHDNKQQSGGKVELDHKNIRKIMTMLAESEQDR